MAYFTDEKAMTNTFTVGNVEIKMTEAPVVADLNGDLIKADGNRNEADADGEEFDYGTLFPMQTIYKDPTIENTGSEAAYVAAKIVISNSADTLQSTTLKNEAAVKAFITGAAGTALADTANKVVIQAEGNDWVIYILCTNALTGKTDTVAGGSVVLFDHVNIDADWGNEEMAVLKNLTIKVTAYATQVKGFADAKEAIQTAFATEFGTIFN
jgi:hypothetical protein